MAFERWMLKDYCTQYGKMTIAKLLSFTTEVGQALER